MCMLFAFILFPCVRLDVCNRSKNLGDMLRISIRGWKPRTSLNVTVVASLSQLTDIFHSTHFKTKSLSPTTSHLSFVKKRLVCNYPSRFCTKSTRGDTDESSLVKMTENLISILAQRWRIGLVFYSTPFRVVVTQVWRALKFGENLSARSASRTSRWQVFPELQRSPNLRDHDRNGVEYITRPILHRWASIKIRFSVIFTRDDSYSIKPLSKSKPVH